MEGSDWEQEELSAAEAEQRIRLEKVRRSRIKVEIRHGRRLERRASRKRICGILEEIPVKVVAGIVAALVVVAVALFGFGLPILLDDHETTYLSETSLKEAVNVENLITLDYTYKGIAEKTDAFLLLEMVSYRVRYEAHVSVYYDMSSIEFSMDEANRIVTAYLPDAEIGAPVLDIEKFGFLPEDASATAGDVIDLCKEDVARELDQEVIQSEASENLQNTIEALTMPLLGEEWQLEFGSLSEYEGEKGVQVEAE